MQFYIRLWVRFKCVSWVFQSWTQVNIQRLLRTYDFYNSVQRNTWCFLKVLLKIGTVSLLDDDVCSVMSNSLQPMGCSPPGSSVHADSPGKNWNGWSCPPPEDLPNSGIKPTSLRSPALADGFFTTGATWDTQVPGKPKYLAVSSVG